MINLSRIGRTRSSIGEDECAQNCGMANIWTANIALGRREKASAVWCGLIWFKTVFNDWLLQRPSCTSSITRVILHVIHLESLSCYCAVIASRHTAGKQLLGPLDEEMVMIPLNKPVGRLVSKYSNRKQAGVTCVRFRIFQLKPPVSHLLLPTCSGIACHEVFAGIRWIM
jgi:hypothetical protein